MIATFAAIAALQIPDGIGLNATTFGIVSAVVVGMAGTITLLFRMVTSNDRQQITDLKAEKAEMAKGFAAEKERLEGERQALMDELIDTLRTAHRSTDAATDAANELMKRQGKRPR